ncbi:hypothetical protein JXA63_00790 [Candidatus Woesebacteria bacterium]|nr:hypothetical protein [Candidatus Woesebacteria bacterium]
MAKVQFSGKAIKKMEDSNLSEKKVLDAYKGGDEQKWSNGKGFNSVKKYPGYEIGVAYFKNDEGTSIITSVWKRKRR